jgi:hypothetical protein
MTTEKDLRLAYKNETSLNATNGYKNPLNAKPIETSSLYKVWLEDKLTKALNQVNLSIKDVI